MLDTDRFHTIGSVNYYSESANTVHDLILLLDTQFKELFWAQQGYCGCCGPAELDKNDLQLVKDLASFGVMARRWSREVTDNATDAGRIKAKVDALTLKVVDYQDTDFMDALIAVQDRIQAARDSMNELVRIKNAFDLAYTRKMDKARRELDAAHIAHNKLTD